MCNFHTKPVFSLKNFFLQLLILNLYYLCHCIYQSAGGLAKTKYYSPLFD